jgi:hypothetical protein
MLVDIHGQALYVGISPTDPGASTNILHKFCRPTKGLFKEGVCFYLKGPVVITKNIRNSLLNPVYS